MRLFSVLWMRHRAGGFFASAPSSFTTPAVLLFHVLLFSAFGYMSADAITQGDLNQIQNQTLTAEIKQLEYTESIQNKINEITRQEIIIENLKNKLKDTKSNAGQSWDDARTIIDGKQDIINAQNDLTLIQIDLQKLIDAKNYQVKLVKSLKDNLTKAKLELDNIPKIQETVNINNTDQVKLIGVLLSQSCITADINNITSICPTYDDLIHLDTSIIQASGNFTTQPYTHREHSPYQNQKNYYDLDNTIRTIIDPPFDFLSHIPIITIEPTLPIRPYSITDTRDSQTFSYATHRFTDKCNTVIISASNWKLTLNDTIQYIRNSCNENYTNIDTIINITIQKQDIKPSSSPSYLQHLYYQTVFELCRIYPTCQTP